MKLRKYNGLQTAISVLEREIKLQTKERLRHDTMSGARYEYEQRLKNMKKARQVLLAMHPYR